MGSQWQGWRICCIGIHLCPRVGLDNGDEWGASRSLQPILSRVAIGRGSWMLEAVAPTMTQGGVSPIFSWLVGRTR
jgi:hypothetical protein